MRKENVFFLSFLRKESMVSNFSASKWEWLVQSFLFSLTVHGILWECFQGPPSTQLSQSLTSVVHRLFLRRRCSVLWLQMEAWEKCMKKGKIPKQIILLLLQLLENRKRNKVFCTTSQVVTSGRRGKNTKNCVQHFLAVFALSFSYQGSVCKIVAVEANWWVI